MALLTDILTGVAATAAVVLLLGTTLLYLPLRWRPLGRYLMVFKLLAVAFVPLIAISGAGLALVGALLGSWWVAVPATAVALGAGLVTLRIGSVRPDLAPVAGDDWQVRIPAERRRQMVGPRWRGRIPRDPDPVLRTDVPFATIPGTDRALLCDVWQPPEGTPHSGVAVVYVHGSAYYVFDKDFCTRRMFRHLAAQGHVIVDVAHRLFPETNVPGMVADTKRAVVWVHEHALELGVDPQRIVLAGGSSGGHLALLAAYSRKDPALTPTELIESDPQVRAVVSLYGQVHLGALYEHTGQGRVCHAEDPQPDWHASPPAWMRHRFGHDADRLRLQFMTVAGRCDWLMGGTPSEVPERYAAVSALTYVDSDCPPTVLIHGTHDEMAPVAEVPELVRALHHAGVPVVAAYLPHTDHAFDLVAWSWSPAARIATYVLERILAALAINDAGSAPPWVRTSHGSAPSA